MSHLRYEGTRWKILYGHLEGPERIALLEIQRIAQLFVPYVLTVEEAGSDTNPDEDSHLLLLGTTESNPLLEQLVGSGSISIPDRAESFSIASFDSPWRKGSKIVAIAGRDPKGVLNGVQDFCARVLTSRLIPDEPHKMREVFDTMPAFSFSESPRIENRGIWTWGYVIYNYRGFLDNMARLKMNMLTIWNDLPPINIREIIDYAHERGIRVILGFHWGWGIPGLELHREEDRKHIREIVVENYRRNYRDLRMDGIYFQTITEHHTLEAGGRSTAAWACQLVNETAASLYELSPDLLIQFGLHATSIRDRYTDLASLDPRVTIVWEDAGGIPFSYTMEDWKEGMDPFHDPEETVRYAKKLATFREGTEFAMVPKGIVNLRWPSEFEHHGPFVLGERDRDFIRNRLRERAAHWDRLNTQWLRNYPIAQNFYRELLKENLSNMTVTALVEDGLFEQAIQPSVSLFAQMVWNPECGEKDLLERALSPYYRRER